MTTFPAKTDQTRNLYRGLAIPAGLALAAALWLLVSRSGSPSGLVPAAGAAGIAAAMCVLASLRRTGGDRSACLALALGCLIAAYSQSTAADTAWMANSQGGLAAALFLALIVLGSARLTTTLAIGERPKTLSLDLVAPGTALSVMAWVYVAGSAATDRELALEVRIESAVAGLGAVLLALVFLGGLLLSARVGLTTPARWLLAGASALALGMAAAPARGLGESTRLAETAMAVGFLLMAGFAILLYRRAGRVADSYAMPMSGSPPAWVGLLPFISVSALLLIAGEQVLVGERAPFGAAIAIIGAFLAVAVTAARQAHEQRHEARLHREIWKLNHQIDGLMSQVGRDPLTGLLNHRAVHERLEHELASGRTEGHPVAVVLIDVDNFKAVNDTLGHQAGDRVLRTVASILESACRTSDIAARYAGDEFMLLLPGLDELDAGQVCARIAGEVQRINDDLRLGREMRITLSIGVAVAYRCHRSTPQTVAIADAAMYDAKESGKNRVVVVNADTLEVSALPAGEDAIVQAMAASRELFPWVMDERRHA